MPLPQTSGWQDATQSVNALGNSLNNVFVGLAQQRAQQQMLQQQMIMKRLEMQQQERLAAQQGKMYDAHTALYGAQQVLEQAKAKDVEREASVRSQLAEDLSVLPLFEPNTVRQQALMGRILGGMGQLPDAGRANLPENIAQMLQMGDVNMQQLMATGTKARIPVAQQGGIYNPVSGAIEAMMPQQLGRENLVDPTTGQTIAQGVPATVKDQTTDTLTRMYGSLRAQLGDLLRAAPFVPPDSPQIKGVQDQMKQVFEELSRRVPGLGTGAPAATTGPKAGDIENGYQFMGGDPADKRNWKKVVQPRAGLTNEPPQITIP